jgi:hypothetical protein
MTYKHLATSACALAALLLASCACDPSNTQRLISDYDAAYHAMPVAPTRGSIVYARENNLPVRVTYVHLPYIDAGAVVQQQGPQHVISRGYVPRAAQGAGSAEQRAPLPDHDAPPLGLPMEQSSADGFLPRGTAPAPSQWPTPPLAPRGHGGNSLAENYCIHPGQTPEKDGCIYPK